MPWFTSRIAFFQPWESDFKQRNWRKCCQCLHETDELKISLPRMDMEKAVLSSVRKRRPLCASKVNSWFSCQTMRFDPTEISVTRGMYIENPFLVAEAIKMLWDLVIDDFALKLASAKKCIRMLQETSSQMFLWLWEWLWQKESISHWDREMHRMLQETSSQMFLGLWEWLWENKVFLIETEKCIECGRKRPRKCF